MQPDDKSYDIKACLADIELSILEIYDFLPSENDFIKKLLGSPGGFRKCPFASQMHMFLFRMCTFTS